MKTYEIAISTINKEPLNGYQRIQEGDIVTIRPAKGYVGKKEMKNFLWLTIDLTDEQLAKLQDYNTLDLDKNLDPLPNQPKRRKKIDLMTLKTRMPSLDLDRVRNTEDSYQPLVDMDTKTGTFTSSPLSFENLVTDKLTNKLVK